MYVRPDESRTNLQFSYVSLHILKWGDFIVGKLTVKIFTSSAGVAVARRSFELCIWKESLRLVMSYNNTATYL